MLVSVVVPNEENTKNWAQQNGYKGSFVDLCSLDKLKDHILLELKSTAERNKVSAHVLFRISKIATRIISIGKITYSKLCLMENS